VSSSTSFSTPDITASNVRMNATREIIAVSTAESRIVRWFVLLGAEFDRKIFSPAMIVHEANFELHNLQEHGNCLSTGGNPSDISSI
jgi:hypothetical protein